MSKIVFGYSYIYYSFYKYYKTKMDFSKDWPEGWGVVAISTVVTLLFSTVELTLIEMDIITVEAMKPIKWLPDSLQIIWFYLFITFLNFYFFFVNKRWMRIVSEYDSLPTKTKMLSHYLSGVLIAIIVIGYLVKLLTFS